MIKTLVTNAPSIPPNDMHPTEHISFESKRREDAASKPAQVIRDRKDQSIIADRSKIKRKKRDKNKHKDNIAYQKKKRRIYKPRIICGLFQITSGIIALLI